MADLERHELAISLDKVCFVIVKAHGFDVKEELTDPDSGSNASDDRMVDVLEDTPGDPVMRELTGFINAMSVDEQIDLVTLMWLGRSDDNASEWPRLREQAARAHNRRTASYLLGEPMLGDCLEEGLGKLDLYCHDSNVQGP